VFLRCNAKECITLEGADAATLARWLKNLGWSIEKSAAVLGGEDFALRRLVAAFSV
jgi:hypothetical protein